MLSLDIYDMSAFIHSVKYNEHYNSRSYYGFPVGGIHYFFKHLMLSYMSNNDIILCFDGRTNKRKEIFESYKGSRIADRTVIMQLQLLYDLLSQCGFACYREDGYEGDDFIAWAVQQGLKDPSQYIDITIYGNDHDLAHNVQNKVKLSSIRKDGVDIDMSTFSYTASKDTQIRFNTISAYKTFCGCTSDEIPVFRSKGGIRGIELYRKFIEMLDKSNVGYNYVYTSSKQVLLKFIDVLPDSVLDAEDKELLRKRAEIVYPFDNPGILVNGWDKGHINVEQFKKVLHQFNDRDSLYCLKEAYYPLTDEEKKFLKDKAYLLSSGASAVDNNIPVNPVSVQGTCLIMDDF